ncbi:MAG: hypothetical protein JNN30_18200 [Rhodanobacteraceae bacterium]|nr:hypothetical protein [Rhodanobacteraceae bacterium]
MNALSIKLLRFLRNNNLRIGDVVPEKPFRFGFLMGLNPKEQAELDDAMAGLVSIGYLEERTPTRYGSIPLFLTKPGFDHIYSSEFEEATDIGAATMTVQNFNFHGTSNNIQIGNNNTQQIVSAIELLAKEIDKANVPEEAKAEAKGRLAAVFDNPVISGLLSGVGVEALKKLVGL